MNVLEALRSGALHVRFDEAGLEVQECFDRYAVLVDPEHEVVWDVVAALPDVRVDEGLLEEWRLQVARDARELFDAEHAHHGGEDQARTADPAWSPLVESGIVDCAGPALQLIHRRAYEPGREWVVGRLMVPLGGGTLQLSASALSEHTGWRECAVMLLVGNQGLCSQAVYDDPQHDATFPHHVLARARAALARMRGRLERLVRPESPPHGAVELPQHRLSVVPPPRFTQMAGAPGMRPAVFVRVGLSATNLTETFDVWRHDRCGYVEDADALAQLAEDNVRAWAREGVTGIEVDVAPGAPRPGCSTVNSEVRFVAGGRRHCASMTWILIRDSCAIRLALTTPPEVPAAERRRELDLACASLRLGPTC